MEYLKTKSTTMLSCVLLILIVPPGIIGRSMDIELPSEHPVTSEFLSRNSLMVSLSKKAVTDYLIGLSYDGHCQDIEELELNHTRKSYTYWLGSDEKDPRASRKLTVCYKVASHTNWDTFQVTQLQDGEPPVFVKSPNHENTQVAHLDYVDDISVDCSAKGYPAPNITWYVNRVPRNTTTTFPNSTLTESELTIPDYGSYYCEAKNDFGSLTSQQFQIEMPSLGEFPAKPKKVETLNEGGHYLLSCADRPLSLPVAHTSIFWLKLNDSVSHEVITDARVISAIDERSSFQNGSLVFTNLIEADSGIYECEVFNDMIQTSATGSKTELIIKKKLAHRDVDPQLIYQFPSGQNIATVNGVQGKTVRMQCIYTAKHDNPRVEWFKNGDSRPLDNLHGSNTVLELRNVQDHDYGQYTCQPITDSLFTGTKGEFNLIVLSPPTLEEKPKNVRAYVGTTHTFRCSADGHPGADIKWYLNSNEVDLKGFAVSDDKETLTISDVQKESAGTIQCVASNIYGYESAEASLIVYDKSQVTKKPSNQPLQSGKVSKVSCGIKQDKHLSSDIIWMRNDTQVKESRTVYVDAEKQLTFNLTTGAKDRANIYGMYSCLVVNPVANVTLSFRVFKFEDPTAGASKQVNETGTTANHFVANNWPLLVGVIGGTLVVLVMIIAVVNYKLKKKIAVESTATLQRLASQISRQTSQMSNHTNEENGDVVALVPNDALLAQHVEDPQLQLMVQEVYIDRDRIERGGLVGKGQFGRVYKAKLLDGKGDLEDQVAVKTLKYKAEETDMVEQFLREAVRMKDFRHANVLGLIGISFDRDTTPLVILPYMANGDLRKYIQDSDREITVLELLKLGLQVARGMTYLSAKRFVHRDLACRNCMVDENEIVKVGDFGLSRDLFSRDYYRVGEGSMPLPVRWMAPECLEDNIFNSMSDVWSYGILLWELLTRGAMPYPDLENFSVGAFIAKGGKLQQPVYCPDSIYQIMERCWNSSPYRRPSFHQVAQELDSAIRAARSSTSSTHGIYSNMLSTQMTDYRQTTV